MGLHGAFALGPRGSSLRMRSQPGARFPSALVPQVPRRAGTPSDSPRMGQRRTHHLVGRARLPRGSVVFFRWCERDGGQYFYVSCLDCLIVADTRNS